MLPGFPPGMMEGPKRAPSSPPETPVPMNRMPLAARSLVRRLESVKSELPPSMMMSPFSRKGRTWSMVWSTTSPALTMIMTRRGLLRRPQNSSIEWAPTTCVPLASLLMKSSTLETVRLKTATLYPWSFILRTRFCPMTARPIKPMSQLAFSIEALSESSPAGRLNILCRNKYFTELVWIGERERFRAGSGWASGPDCRDFLIWVFGSKYLSSKA